MIHATDGEIGAVASLMVDKESWVVHRVLVETGHWYAGKEILIPMSAVERISYEDSQVLVRLTKTAIQQTAGHDVAKPVR